MNEKAPEDTRRSVGIKGEAAARDLVTRRGWRIIDHNVRWREGEIDLIALDGSTLVFGEVKALVARGGATRFSPFESIGRRKQAQIRSLARRWLVDDLRRCYVDGPRFSAIRFDAFAVLLDERHELLEIEHLEDAF